MNKDNKKFVKYVLVIVSIMLVITATLGYILDPNMYYRKSKHDIYYSEAYTTAGLIKNYNADIAFVGSSMFQNMDMDLVRELYNQEPIKYTMGGMNVDETCMLINRAISLNNGVDTFVVNIDLTMFNTDEKEPYKKYPKYIYDENIINDFKYLLGLKTWTRFIPFNIIYNMSKMINSPITNKVTESFINEVDVDNIGKWDATFGKDIVISKYKKGSESVSDQNINDMLQRMKDKFNNDFYPTFEENTDKEFIIVFPPYSALFWYNADENNYKDEILEFKKYIVEQFEDNSNVTIYDFQDNSEIVDLDNYKDTTHYVKDFNDMMIESIYNKENIVNIDNIDKKIENINVLLDKFKENNSDILK